MRVCNKCGWLSGKIITPQKYSTSTSVFELNAIQLVWSEFNCFPINIYLKTFKMISVSKSQGRKLGCSVSSTRTSNISSTEGIGLGREWLRYLTASLTATNLIFELASAYIRSGSRVPLNGPVLNPFWSFFFYYVGPLLSSFILFFHQHTHIYIFHILSCILFLVDFFGVTTSLPSLS